MAPRRRQTADAEDPRQARDVMAFGQEIGRVLSDGRIVGRTEPFAKVFPSSRAVKRAAGLVAWGILEDIALDARLDDHGRLVAETNVRRIAANLGLSKTTVHKHLAVLREFGFVFHEGLREAESGRYEQVRYVIDPSACIERFTTAPGPGTRPAGGGGAAPQDGRSSGDGRVPGAGTRVAPVYQSTGHGDLVQQTEEQDAVVGPRQQPPAGGRGEPERDLVDGLTAVGLAPAVAADLVAEHPGAVVRDALDAVGVKRLHNPAGWVVRAISGRWDVSGDAAQARAARARAAARKRDELGADERREQERDRQTSSAAWAAAVSAAMDDRQLAEAIQRLTSPLPGLERRYAPAVCAALVLWAQAVVAVDPGRPLDVALRLALAARPTPDDVPDIAPEVSAPTPCSQAADLSGRVSALLGRDRRGSASTAMSCP
jgi:DNA-binding transcriptional ArsR family regulator